MVRGVGREVIRRGIRTDSGRSLLLQDIHAFDNRRAGVVDAVQHRLKEVSNRDNQEDNTDTIQRTLS